MHEFLSTPTAQVVIWVSVLLLVALVGFYVVCLFRQRGVQRQESANDLLSQFRKLHEQGEISQAEFRHIKTVLGPRIREELGSKDAERDV